jgi:TetR/AcrR family transcriptional repressor of mexJK operon
MAAVPTTAPDARAPRGSIAKRQAILDAAFAVFVRRGYALAHMEDIADEAGVAKPTLYKHFADKETLFHETLAATAQAIAQDNVVALDQLREPGADLAAMLLNASREMLETCCGDRSRGLRRLIHSQVAVFPGLVEMDIRASGQVGEALADRLARLSLAGVLRPCDPATAAEHLLSMLTGPMERRSLLGTREVSAAEVRAVCEAAVDTFLRAYGVEEPA